MSVHHPFNLRVAHDEEAMSRSAAEFIVAELRRNDQALLCLSAGATPLRTYRRLAEHRSREPRFFENAHWLQLDEWLGIASDHDASCRTFLQRHLLGPLGVDPARFIGWNPDAPDIAAECRRIATAVEALGAIDVAVLGLGINGHLGLNEPADELLPGPHVAELSEATRHHSMLATAQGKVSRGVTLGMGDLLRARRIVLLVSGEHKQASMQQLLQHKISTRFPASLLWLHPDVTLFCDRAALGTAIYNTTP
jgi:galactosamine-6-phosphate isomerase